MAEHEKSSISFVGRMAGMGRRLDLSVCFCLFLVLSFFGALCWAHSFDPFQRTEFKVKAGAGYCEGITVLPRRLNKALALPTVIYAHGSGESWLTDGSTLRQFAELGMAAVSFNYDPTKGESFRNQFAAVIGYVNRQSWVKTNAIAWVGLSLGAQDTLRYLLDESGPGPLVYVRLAGGWIANLDKSLVITNLKCSVLLIHGQNDNLFLANDAKRLADVLRSNSLPVTLYILPNLEHAFGGERPMICRLVAEYCKSKLTPGHPLPEFPGLHPYSFLLCMLPALVWFGFGVFGRLKALPAKVWVYFIRLHVVYRIIIVVVVIVAATDAGLHLWFPRMTINRYTIAIARKTLVTPKLDRDFDFVVGLKIWDRQSIKTLLTHVELASYTVKELINWKVPSDLYLNYVLSPVIVQCNLELNWRRELWENFYPRIRHENTPSDAAAIVVRFLRQRVTVSPGYPNQHGVESMWNGRIVNANDFEVLYVAALRSVGVPARLNRQGLAEFWAGDVWESAPRPLAITWVI